MLRHLRKRLIIFLIRKHLRLRKNEHFRFTNQLSRSNTYYFTDDAVMKRTTYCVYPSSVSINWLLNDDCRIKKVEVNPDVES